MPQPTIAQPNVLVFAIGLSFQPAPGHDQENPGYQGTEGRMYPFGRGLTRLGSSKESGADRIAVEQHCRLPEILQAAQQRGSQHGPDQAVAAHAAKPAESSQVARAQQHNKNGDDGGTLQTHFELAQPVRAKASA